MRNAVCFTLVMQTKHAADEDGYFTPAQVAVLFGVARDTVKRWEAAGKLPAAKRTPTGHRRYPRAAIDAVLREFDRSAR